MPKTHCHIPVRLLDEVSGILIDLLAFAHKIDLARLLPLRLLNQLPTEEQYRAHANHEVAE